MMTRRSFGLFAASCLFAQQREKAKGLNLKITDLKTFIVNRGGVNAPNYVFVKLYTNQGLTGLGEGSVTSKALTMAAAIEEHKRYLVGLDPCDIEMHWQAMFRWPRWRGGPILNSAISAVEIAMWDILG
jgi:galactonate dehydratase